MRVLAYMLMFLTVMGLGFWAYTENYATQQVLKDVSRLNAEIGELREALSIQRAEWAYLNRPDRLRDLATINFDRLGLLPLQPEQFGPTSLIAYPVPVEPAPLPLTVAPVDVQGELPAAAGAPVADAAPAGAAPEAAAAAPVAPAPVFVAAKAPAKPPKARPAVKPKKPAAAKAPAAAPAKAAAPKAAAPKPAPAPAAQVAPAKASPAPVAPAARPPLRKPQVKTP